MLMAEKQSAILYSHLFLCDVINNLLAVFYVLLRSFMVLYIFCNPMRNGGIILLSGMLCLGNLTVRFVQSVTEPAKYHDGVGLGLYLRVDKVALNYGYSVLL